MMNEDAKAIVASNLTAAYFAQRPRRQPPSKTDLQQDPIYYDVVEEIRLIYRMFLSLINNAEKQHQGEEGEGSAGAVEQGDPLW